MESLKYIVIMVYVVSTALRGYWVIAETTCSSCLNMGTLAIGVFAQNAFIVGLLEQFKKDIKLWYNNRQLKKKNLYYRNELGLVKESMEKISGMRHDMKNHLLYLRTLAEEKKENKMIEYLDKCLKVTSGYGVYVKTGVLPIDSILNYKLEQARKNNIRVETDIQIPRNLQLPDFEWISILGNVMDNAIEAANQVGEDAYILVRMKCQIGNLFIQVVNSCTGKIEEKDGRILTTKKNKEKHGWGLKNIQKVVTSCDGNIKYFYEKDFFEVRILMPIEEKK